MELTTALPSELTINEGESLTLKVEVSKPNQKVTWYKKDLEIIPEVEKQFKSSSEDKTHYLTIEQATLEDEGEFAVEVGKLSSFTKLNVTREYIYEFKFE